MKVLCLIPARSGSKGIKDKNLISFAGKPLIRWSIDAAHRAELDRDNNRIVVSTDSKEYATKIESWYRGSFTSNQPELCPFIRPKKIARDDTPTKDVILHAIAQFDGLFDTIIVLEPTAPLRTISDITIPLSMIRDGKCKAVVSVCDEHRAHPSLSFRINRGFIQPNTDTPHLRRQQLEPFYHLTGTIYAADIEFYLEHKTFITDRTMGYKVNRWQDQEIDCEDDLLKILPFMERIK